MQKPIIYFLLYGGNRLPSKVLIVFFGILMNRKNNVFCSCSLNFNMTNKNILQSKACYALYPNSMTYSNCRDGVGIPLHHNMCVNCIHVFETVSLWPHYHHCDYCL